MALEHRPCGIYASNIFFFASIRTCLHISGCKLVPCGNCCSSKTPQKLRAVHQAISPKFQAKSPFVPSHGTSPTALNDKGHVCLGSITKVLLFLFSLSELLIYVNRHPYITCCGDQYPRKGSAPHRDFYIYPRYLSPRPQGTICVRTFVSLQAESQTRMLLKLSVQVLDLIAENLFQDGKKLHGHVHRYRDVNQLTCVCRMLHGQLNQKMYER
jgi:hypothetical protein